jgi:hypothetical protein
VNSAAEEENDDISTSGTLADGTLLYLSLCLDFIYIYSTQISHGLLIGLAAQMQHKKHPQKWSTLIELSPSLHMSSIVDLCTQFTTKENLSRYL